MVKLTTAQVRILRDANRNDAVVVNGRQRMPVDQLHSLGLVRFRTVHVPTGRGYRRDQITVEITRAGQELLWSIQPTVGR